ncbi:hypothetical protein [Aquimarina sp. 2304DJ70-9]|uniref:hypothetical protein n=1 Tax=Aquimarina penaris TaxID=3231044 RepID=UPI003461E8AE
MKKILNLGKPLSKKEQLNIHGGHGVSGLFCLAKCAAKFKICADECGLLDTNCVFQCEIDLRCCKEECGPEGGQPR